MSKRVAPHDPDFFETLNDDLGGILLNVNDFSDLDVPIITRYGKNVPWETYEDEDAVMTADNMTKLLAAPKEDAEPLVDFLNTRIENTPDFLTRKYDSDTQLVFVYGTLKAGHGNHGLLKSAKFLGRGETRVFYSWLKRTGFPVVMHRPGGTDHRKVGKIVGEVYACDLETMARLDCLESNGHMYKREQVSVCLRDQRFVEAASRNFVGNPYKPCWMYIGCEDYWRNGVFEDASVEDHINVFKWR